MESTNESAAETQNQQLKDGYYYCPNCGDMDLEYFDEVLPKKISKEEYNQLSEEQKRYINKRLEYGALLCDDCLNKVKKKSWIIRGLFLVALVLLYINPIFGIMATILLIPINLYMEKYELTRDFDFKHAWQCRAVRRLRSE